MLLYSYIIYCIHHCNFISQVLPYWLMKYIYFVCVWIRLGCNCDMCFSHCMLCNILLQRQELLFHWWEYYLALDHYKDFMWFDPSCKFKNGVKYIYAVPDFGLPIIMVERSCCSEYRSSILKLQVAPQLDKNVSNPAVMTERGAML